MRRRAAASIILVIALGGASVARAQGPARQWHRTADPGRPLVWGWMEAGHVRFFEHEQPSTPTAAATPGAERPSKPTAASTPTPAPEAPIGQAPEPWQVSGVTAGKLQPPAEPAGRYTSTGPASRAFAAAARAHHDQADGRPPVGDLTDDSGAPRLTVIGADADRARVLADLKGSPRLKAAASGMLVQDYPADHWAVAGLGFPEGRPSISLQDGAGAMLFAATDYPGPDELADELDTYAGQLRRRVPDFDPLKVPGLRGFGLESVPAWAWIGLGVVLLLVIFPAQDRRR